MTTVVNLTKHRKAKAAAQAKAEAVANRVRFGRTKVGKAFDAARVGAAAPLKSRRSTEPKQD